MYEIVVLFLDCEKCECFIVRMMYYDDVEVMKV